MANLISFRERLRVGRRQLPVTRSSKKCEPLSTYCRVCLKGPSASASKTMANPPCDSPGSICLSSEV